MLGQYGFFSATPSLDLSLRELVSCIVLAGLSGAILLAIKMTCNEHDVRQFYAQQHKVTYCLYIVSTFIVWISFAMNAQHVAMRLVTLFLTHGLGINIPTALNSLASKYQR